MGSAPASAAMSRSALRERCSLRVDECHDPANGWRGRKSRGDANAPVLISHPDVLEFTTRRAEAAGLGDQIGSLIPGHTPTSSPSARRPQ
jgi:hypothetical protein